MNERRDFVTDLKKQKFSLFLELRRFYEIYDMIKLKNFLPIFDDLFNSDESLTLEEIGNRHGYRESGIESMKRKFNNEAKIFAKGHTKVNEATLVISHGLNKQKTHYNQNIQVHK